MNYFENVEVPENVSGLAITKLNRDLRNAAGTMTRDEARFLVDSYYQLQDDRIRAKNRVRAFSESKEPSEVITWLSDNTATLEKRVGAALKAYAENDFVGKWAMSICGIGPVISAGLLAHIDIERAPNVGHILSFAGMLPTPRKWEKGQKRPFNAKLKVLLWKIGQSFVKVSNNDNDYYGKVYRRAKAIYEQKNEAGEYAAQAAKKLQDFNIGKDTDAYKAYAAGKLPKAHIQARAERKAVSLFISHWWEVAFRHHFPDRPCPRPYALDVLGHLDYVDIPNNPFNQ